MSVYVIIFFVGLIIGLGFSVYNALQSKWRMEELIDLQKEQKRRDHKIINDLEDELDILMGQHLSDIEDTEEEYGYLV